MDPTDYRPREHSGDLRRLSSGASDPSFLEGASLEELRCEWRWLYHTEPPRISRDLLMRGIGYHLQELTVASAKRPVGS